MTEGLCRSHPIRDGVSSLHIRHSAVTDSHLSNKPSSIPLVKTNSFIDQPLSQQQKWLHAPSFDQTTGNPLIRRDKTPCGKDKLDLAVKDVMNLTDPCSIKREDRSEIGGLEQRIQNRRRTRHQDAILTKQTALEKIDNEIQQDVTRACEDLKRKMAAIDESIAVMLTAWKKPKSLVNATREDIERSKESIEKGNREKRNRIREFEETTDAIETKRADQITVVFSSFVCKLYSIAFMLPSDIKKMVEDEIMDLNMTMLTNKKQYMLLIESLIKADHLLQKDALDKWDKLLVSWTQAHCQLQEEIFSEYMRSRDMIEPAVNQLIDKLQKGQESVVRMETDLLLDMSSIKPCNHNKAVISGWKERHHRTEQILNNVHSTFLSEWQTCQESVYNQCERRMDQLKSHLISSQILESSKTFEFLTEKCIPLMEHHQLQVTQKLNHLQCSLHSVCSTNQSLFLSLFQYTQGAAHVLDSHLAEIDTNNHKKETHLSNVRKEHDLQNQTIEANLDIVLDRLRQCATNEELDEYNRIAQEMLCTIKEGYVTFHNKMSSIVLTYPSETKDELQRYDKKLCEYFGVDRNPPHKKKSRGKQQHGGRSTAKISNASKKPTTQQSMTTPSAPITTPSAPMTTPSTPPSATPPFKDMRTLISEVLLTSNGTSFYIYTKADSETIAHENESSIFMTQTEESEDVSILPIVTKCLVIEDEKFSDTKRSFCINFLDHMENMKKTVVEQTKDKVIGKIEELRTELELRLHLHKPRPIRIKQDIHDIRKVELVAHQERISQHVKAVSHVLQQQRDNLQILPEKLEKQYQKLTDDLMKHRKMLDSAKSSLSLEQIHIEAKETHKKSIDSMEEMLSSNRNISTGQLEDLLSANSEYMSSLRLFSEGGNYCQQEIEAISIRLEKQIERMDKTERTLINGLELIESATAKRTNDIYINIFGVIYQHNSSDVSVLETVSSKLAHCQVLIKTEVLSSNDQSDQLFQSINALKDVALRNEVKVSDFVEMLPSVFKPFHDRVEYLYCKSKIHSGSRVGGQNEDTITGISPISAINLTKSIFKYASSTMTEEGSVQTSKSVAVDTTKQGKKSVSKKQQCVERRNVNYGVGGGKDGTGCFLPKIRSILRSTHSELYSLIEDYYRLKGNKPITRSNEIPDNFEQMLDIQIDKLQDYRVQAEDYRNNCIGELHQQINCLDDALDEIIKHSYEQLSSLSNQTRRVEIDQIISHYNTSKKHLNKTKCCHDEKLRPSLGHPNKMIELKELCNKEKDRFKQSMDAISEHRKKIKNVFYGESRRFAVLLVESTCDMLKVLDSDCLTCQDIVTPIQKPLPPDELLRLIVYKKAKSITDSDSANSILSLVQPDGVWPGLKDLTLAFNSKDVERKLQINVEQSRTTPVHYMVMQARDATAEEYQELCVEDLDKWEQKFEEESMREEKQYQTWNQSVTTVKKLYDT